MRLLDRYLLGAFLRIFLLTALSAPLLFVLADLTERLEVELGRGTTVGEMSLWYLGQFPTYLIWAFPIAALVATLFTLQPLVRHGEIHAMLASGIRLHRLFVPLLIGGTAIAILGVLLLETAPRMKRWGRVEPTMPAVIRGVRTTFAYLTDAGEILSVERLEAGVEGRMYGVSLRSESRHRPGALQYVVAKEARWQEGKGWELRDGQLWNVAPNGAQWWTSFDRLAHRTLTERPRDLLDAPAAEITEMTFAEIGRQAARVERSGASAAYLRTKQWERLAIPLTTLAIVIFAAPLVTVAGRGEGQLGIALALVLTISYLALLRTAESLGFAGLIPPWVAAASPGLVFGLGGLYLWHRARS